MWTLAGPPAGRRPWRGRQERINEAAESRDMRNGRTGPGRHRDGSGGRAGNDQADGWSAERRGDDDQPDRGFGGSGDARGVKRRCEEARRGDVYRHAQPD